MFQLTFEQLAVALAAVFAGAILLLLVGTQILDWYWLALLFAASFGYGLWSVMKRAPSQYQIAQLIDARLHLYDAVSTAFHFANASEPIPDEIKEAQAKQASGVAATADVRAALPYRWPKVTVWTAGLALAALTLFGIRYLVTQSMDTKPSLVAMAFDNFFTPSPDREADGGRTQKKRPLDPDLEKLSVQVNDSETKRSDLDPGNDASNIVDTPEVNNPDSNADGKSKAKTDKVDVKAQGKEEGDEEGEKGKENADSKGKENGDQGNSSNDKNSPQAKNQQQDKKGDQKGDQSSLLDKMKDAMANMLNKLKMDGQQKQQQQQAQNSKEGQQAGKGQQKSDDKGQQDKQGQQQSSEGEQKDQQAQAQGQQGQKQENAQGKGSEQSKQPASPDAKSGIGKSDGNKDVQEAENARAMGKISEILGKRQKDVTGEMMIEVSSGKQQLKTAYSSESAAHKEAGGEINRDEVPLIYQQYVEKYFDQIHATPKAAEASAKDTKPQAGTTGAKVPGVVLGTSGAAK
ncbi:MAG TPA: hypothetical protein VGL53_25910 [Bryobacteraceae bacterium]